MTFGRPSTYLLGDMEIGESRGFPAPTPQDVRRIARNTSQYGIRHNRYYRCSTDTTTRITTVTRIR